MCVCVRVHVRMRAYTCKCLSYVHVYICSLDSIVTKTLHTLSFLLALSAEFDIPFLPTNLCQYFTVIQPPMGVQSIDYSQITLKKFVFPVLHSCSTLTRIPLSYQVLLSMFHSS